MRVEDKLNLTKARPRPKDYQFEVAIEQLSTNPVKRDRDTSTLNSASENNSKSILDLVLYFYSDYEDIKSSSKEYHLDKYIEAKSNISSLTKLKTVIGQLFLQAKSSPADLEKLKSLIKQKFERLFDQENSEKRYFSEKDITLLSHLLNFENSPYITDQDEYDLLLDIFVQNIDGISYEGLENYFKGDNNVPLLKRKKVDCSKTLTRNVRELLLSPDVKSFNKNIFDFQTSVPDFIDQHKQESFLDTRSIATLTNMLSSLEEIKNQEQKIGPIFDLLKNFLIDKSFVFTSNLDTNQKFVAFFNPYFEGDHISFEIVNNDIDGFKILQDALYNKNGKDYSHSKKLSPRIEVLFDTVQNPYFIFHHGISKLVQIVTINNPNEKESDQRNRIKSELVPELNRKIKNIFGISGPVLISGDYPTYIDLNSIKKESSNGIANQNDALEISDYFQKLQKYFHASTRFTSPLLTSILRRKKIPPELTIHEKKKAAENFTYPKLVFFLKKVFNSNSETESGKRIIAKLQKDFMRIGLKEAEDFLKQVNTIFQLNDSENLTEEQIRLLGFVNLVRESYYQQGELGIGFALLDKTIEGISKRTIEPDSYSKIFGFINNNLDSYYENSFVNPFLNQESSKLLRLFSQSPKHFEMQSEIVPPFKTQEGKTQAWLTVNSKDAIPSLCQSPRISNNLITCF
jgi:hypothetical protein